MLAHSGRLCGRYKKEKQEGCCSLNHSPPPPPAHKFLCLRSLTGICVTAFCHTVCHITHLAFGMGGVWYIACRVQEMKHSLLFHSQDSELINVFNFLNLDKIQRCSHWNESYLFSTFCKMKFWILWFLLCFEFELCTLGKWGLNTSSPMG